MPSFKPEDRACLTEIAGTVQIVKERIRSLDDGLGKDFKNYQRPLAEIDLRVSGIYETIANLHHKADRHRTTLLFFLVAQGILNGILVGLLILILHRLEGR